MKKLIIIALLSVIVFNVNAKSLRSSRCQTVQASEKLVLNNGAKWKVDKATDRNVTNLQQVVTAVDSKTARSLPDYRKAGIALQNGIAKMIKECRMKGPDHQALHKWLEPLMEKVAQLNRAPDVIAAARSFDAIKTQLNLFSSYFQA